MKKILKNCIKLFLILVTIIIIFASYYLIEGYSMYKEALEKKPIQEMVQEIKNKDYYISVDDVPQDYLNAIVAVEDRRFYIHRGIDVISIARAILNDLIRGEMVEGGSTITQQLAKNTYFTQSKKLTRKIAEAYMAKEFENNYEKNEILEFYINTMYFGNGYYSVIEASRGYFGKEPNEMNFYDSTMLAGIPNAPSVYAPTKNVNLAIQRQAQVLNKMVRYGYITQELAEKTMNTPYPYHSNLTPKSN